MVIAVTAAGVPRQELLKCIGTQQLEIYTYVPFLCLKHT